MRVNRVVGGVAAGVTLLAALVALPLALRAEGSERTPGSGGEHAALANLAADGAAAAAASEPQAETTPLQTVHVGGTAYYGSLFYESLDGLLTYLQPVVIAGTVESAEIWGNRDIPGVPRSKVPEGPTPDWPPGHPKRGKTPSAEPPGDAPANMTVYEFRISDVLMNPTDDRLVAGDTIAVWQDGGVKDGIESRREEVELLRVGEQYLLFAGRSGTMEWYNAAPFGQFRLDGDTLVAPEYWAQAGVVRELAGRTVDEVRALVGAR